MLLAAFGAAQFMGSPIFGWLADQGSSRRVHLLIGFVGNAIATALLCFTKVLWVLVVSRFLQGLSAAIVYTVGFALLADTVGSKDIGQWMGYVISSVNIGMTVSPTLGGILYEKAGYMSLFYVMFGLIALDIFMRFVMVEKKAAMQWAEHLTSEPRGTSRDSGMLHPDINQATYGQKTDSRPSKGLSDSEDASDDPASSSSDPLIRKDIHHPTELPQYKGHTPPLIHLLKSCRVLADLYGVFVSVTMLASFDSALPIFVERTFGWGSTGGGLIFLPLTLPVLAAPLAGKLADMTDSRWLSATGYIIAAVFTVLLLLVRHDGIQQVALLFALLTLYGFARVVGSSPLGADLARAVESIEKERPGIFGSSGAYAQVFSLYTSASAAGVLVGPAWTSYAYGGKSWTYLVSSLGLLCASAVVPVLLFFGPNNKRNDSSLSTPV
ncbi:hypothetical protein MMC07_009858 [Pseudocyphellaria aurata]|nr:hypothetical protein [Pseudocyphellaria aurata]